MPKGNPNPVIPPKFAEARFKAQGDVDEPLADVAVQVRLTRSIDLIVRQSPNRSAWLRKVITEAAQRELIKDGQP
jgi:hypothetical protein